MNELPIGWIAVTLGDLCSKPQYGFTTKSTVEGQVKYLRTTDLTSGKINWDKVPFCITEPDDDRYQLEDNDIVISRAGSVGFHCLVKQPPAQTVFASYLIRFKPDRAIFPEYLSLFLKSRDYWEQLKSKAVGVAVQNVNATSLSELVVPVAPLNEQIRIADKLDSVLAKVDAAQARLEKIPTLLKRFRQSVLAAATSGELTREWRAANIDINALEELQSLEKTKDSLIKNKLVKKHLAFSVSSELEKPVTWGEVCLGSLSSKITDGEHSTPKRENQGYYLLSARNIRDGMLSLKKVDYVGEEEFIKLRKRCDPNEGDILISCSGSVGRIALCDRSDAYVMVRSAALVKTEYMKQNNKFLMYVLQSPVLQEIIVNKSKATAQANLFLEPIKELPIPYPPKEEQTEIVRRVESLLSQADTVEKQYRAAKQRLDRLSQALLAKAFRGELVPQDPSDEPAAELLKRIQAERTALTPAKRQRRQPV